MVGKSSQILTNNTEALKVFGIGSGHQIWLYVRKEPSKRMERVVFKTDVNGQFTEGET